MWCVRVLGTFFCVKVFHLGLYAVWGCMIANNVCLGSLFILRYLRGGWNPLNKEKVESKNSSRNRDKFRKANEGVRDYMKKIVIIPDSFKGTISSQEAGRIIEEEAKKRWPDVKIVWM